MSAFHGRLHSRLLFVTRSGLLSTDGWRQTLPQPDTPKLAGLILCAEPVGWGSIGMFHALSMNPTNIELWLNQTHCDDCLSAMGRMPSESVNLVVTSPTYNLLNSSIADTEQPWLDLDFHEPLDSVSAASVRYRIAIGPHSGNRTLTLHDPSCIKTDKSPKPLTVDRDGFSLNAAVSCKPYQRERLERLCRYITRPAICLDRLNGKNPFRNGATHILFSPLDFLGKLAALIPRPRHQLVRYHGIFAPNARIRKRIVSHKGQENENK